MVQRGNDIIPVEVKSDENVASRSLTMFAEKYSEQTKLRLRFSLKNLKQNDNLLNIPLCMIDYMDKLIGLGLENTVLRPKPGTSRLQK